MRNTRVVQSKADEHHKVLGQADELRKKANTVRVERDALHEQVEGVSKVLAGAQAAQIGRAAL